MRYYQNDTIGATGPPLYYGHKKRLYDDDVEFTETSREEESQQIKQ